MYPESIEGFIEDQAFLQSYDSAPRPPHPRHPLSRQQVASLSQSSIACICISLRSPVIDSARLGIDSWAPFKLCVASVVLTDGGEGVGEERNQAWPSITRSIPSGCIPVSAPGVAGEIGHEAGDSVGDVCESLALYKSFNTLWLYLSWPQVWLVRLPTRLATVSAMSV
jgi:hypothetical protein